MKTKEIRETSTEDLLAQVAEARRKIVDMKVRKTAAEVAKQPLLRRTLRREVARKLTVVRERELAAAKPVEK